MKRGGKGGDKREVRQMTEDDLRHKLNRDQDDSTFLNRLLPRDGISQVERTLEEGAERQVKNDATKVCSATIAINLVTTNRNVPTLHTAIAANNLVILPQNVRMQK